MFQRYNFSVQTEQIEVCPIIELPDTWEGYLSLLDKKQRHEVRRKLRRAAGASEVIDWYMVGATHDIQGELDRFLILMAASDIEKAEFLKDAQNLTFFKKIVPLIHEKGWLQLSFLTINKEAVAAYVNFAYNNRILVYNSGLSHEQYGHLSPGIVLLAHNIRQAIEEKFTVFDFLRGDEVYKYRMGGKDTAVFQITARPPV